jgi:hypothetical protein
MILIGFMSKKAGKHRAKKTNQARRYDKKFLLHFSHDFGEKKAGVAWPGMEPKNTINPAPRHCLA